MSSNLVEVEKTSRKRKHEGDSKSAKKKRKQTDDTVETNGVDEEELAVKLSKREKKKREKQGTGDANESQNDGPSTTIDGTPKPTSTSKKEKKKKKRKDAESPQPEAPVEEETAAPDVQEDEEMPDVSDTEQTAANPLDGTGPQHDDAPAIGTDQLQSDAPTSFHSIRMSLYLPIPAIASTGHMSAILALHLSPLLLTYFPPVSGVVLSYHDPVLSARPEAGLSKPLLPPNDEEELPNEHQETLARLGDEFGSTWAWLTVTFLVFQPQTGDRLTGWTNAMSEGFIGLVSYNYFQSSIAKSRIPRSWTWSRPSRQRGKQRKAPRKGKLNDSDGPSQESYIDSQETIVAREDDAMDGIAGSFVDGEANNVPEDLGFKVVDLEMIPAQERGQRFALQLDGTLLGAEEEQAVREEGRLRWETRHGKRVSRSRMSSRASTPGTPTMSRALAASGRAASVVSTP